VVFGVGETHSDQYRVVAVNPHGLVHRNKIPLTAAHTLEFPVRWPINVLLPATIVWSNKVATTAMATLCRKAMHFGKVFVTVQYRGRSLGEYRQSAETSGLEEYVQRFSVWDGIHGHNPIWVWQ
jgi:hypothetical protein